MAINSKTRELLKQFVNSPEFANVSPENQRIMTEKSFGLGFSSEDPDRRKQLARLTSMAQEGQEEAAKRAPEEAFGLNRLKDIDDPFGAAKTLREGIALPALSFLDAASLGNIRRSAKKSGEVFPEQEKTNIPGRALSGIGTLAGFVKSPILRGAGKLKSPALIGIKSPGARKIAQGALTGAIRGGVASGIAAPIIQPEGTSELSARAKQALVGAGIGATIGAIGPTIQALRDAPGKKVDAIRKGFRTHTLKEYEAYDDAINKLSKEGGTLQGDRVLEGIEKRLIDKGLFGTDGKIINRPLSSAEGKLIKSYNRLLRKFALSKDGSIQTKDVIKEYQDIRGVFKGGKVTLQQRDLREAADDIFDSARDQIDSKIFKSANKRYSLFKQDQALLDSNIKLFPKSPKQTATGERFLTEKFGKTKEAREVADVIKTRAGQSLRGAEISSKFGFLKNPGALAGLGALGGLGLLGSKIARAIKSGQSGGGSAPPPQ